MTTPYLSTENLLRKQREEFLGFKKLPYIVRAKEQVLRENLSNSLIKIVMGPRRAGKSRLIQKVTEESNVAYLNFEEAQFKQTSTEELIEAATKVYPSAQYWYLDEIQDHPEWETFLNKLHRRKYNLLVTGSNAKLLSSELATALTGRHCAIELFPFSYQEFLSAKNSPPGWNSFQEYLGTGGFPEVVLSTNIDPKNYLSTLFDAIVLKDMVQRKKIRNPLYLSNTLSLLINNIAARTSSRALSKALSGSPSAITIEKYIELAREAYLIECLSKYSTKTKERIQSERKPFAIDTGFIQAKAQQVMPLHSKLLENAVFQELRRRGLQSNHTLFYHRDDQGIEIDFLVRNGHTTTDLIQVCLDLSALKTKERELRAFNTALKEHPKSRCTIVTAHERGSLTTDSGATVQLVPAYEFCA